MKIKWLATGISVILLLVSCGAVKKEMKPAYRFELGKVYPYKLKADCQLDMKAGPLIYSGQVVFTADIEIKAVETNAAGYKIQFDIKNHELEGADTATTAFFEFGLIYIRNWLGSFYLTTKGRPTVVVNNNPVLGLNAYASLIFPDFSDEEGIWKGKSEMTNFPARYDKQEIVIVYKHNWGIKDVQNDSLIINNQIQFLSYTKEDFSNTVEPQPVGNITVDFEDNFNMMLQQLISKKGNIQINFNLTLKQGFFSYILSLQGKGNFEMTPDKAI